MRRLLGLFIVPAFVLLSSAPTLAFNQRITVYASVPMMRVIYLDSSSNIVKVSGNTSQNIEPKVYNQNNQQVAMTDAIKAQYDNFLKSYGGHIQASKTYIVNPVVVNNSANTQLISIGQPPERLSLSL